MKTSFLLPLIWVTEYLFEPSLYSHHASKQNKLALYKTMDIIKRMADKQPNILILSRQTNSVQHIAGVMGVPSRMLLFASSPLEAMQLIQEYQIELILYIADETDQYTPSAPPAEANNYASLEMLRNFENTADIPIILIGSHPPDVQQMESLSQTGPVVFVNKPFSPAVLMAEIKNFRILQQYKRDYQRLADEGTVLKLELSRRSKQLAISNQAARHISSILDLDELLNAIVQLIQKEFRYYYTGIWLIGGDNKVIELGAGSYDDGHITLNPGYKLQLENSTCIIAHVCQTFQKYVTQNVLMDPYYLATETLPDTQAELTIPLLAKSKLLGVIDIQSDRQDAFHPDDVEILSALADQIAVAIRNASLYHEVLHAREELEDKIQSRTRELRESNEQLALLEQNKTDFIQVLSHELRTPLTLVSGYAELLLAHELADSDPFFFQQVMGVMTGAQRLHELIDSMVDMLKIDSRSLQLMPQHLSIESILSPLIATFDEALLKRNLSLTVSDIDLLPEIEGDLELLSKVFDQLLTNAIKYTPDGGQISMVGRHLNQEFAGVIEEFVEISISDTGIGISQAHLDVIFTKFYRIGDVSQHSSGKVKFKGGGPGLGLSIARGIVEAHQGRIWAESPGYDEVSCPGSCFYVLLPLTQKM